MKKLFLSVFTLLLSICVSATPLPDEGMWLPLFIKDYNYESMQQIGLKMTAEQMYDINHSSLKDAIVQLGHFCTGEIVSNDGLMLTNHHCGYNAIANHSSEEHDYLKDGFWAKNRGEELPNEGLTATFLIRMDDVTGMVLSEVTRETSESERATLVASAIDKLKEEHSENGKYTIVVKPFFEGNEFYMFTYLVYRDVRLVGAPPSSIGKFGGDTDNWMWPRHTGDFTIFRIYSAPDGSPAAYAPENIPLKAKYHLPISLKGVEKGDYSMVWGFPGSTQRYMTSYEINNLITIQNPATIQACDLLLPVIRDEMMASDKVRIEYASHYASLANMWKNKRGETTSLIKLRVAAKKEIQEETLNRWIDEDENRSKQYGNPLKEIQAICNDIDRWRVNSYLYTNFFRRASKIFMLPYLLQEVEPKEGQKSFPDEQKQKVLQAYSQRMIGVDAKTEEKIVAASFALWEKLPPGLRPDIYSHVQKYYKGNIDLFSQAIATKSIFSSPEKLESFLQKPSLKKYAQDPLVVYFNAVFDVLYAGQDYFISYSKKLEVPRRHYLAAVKAMNDTIPIYPDANSTMRMSYGQVLDYYPVDGVHYKHFTTASGILEKEKPGDPEFEIPAKLKQLILDKDFGKYGSEDTLPVCFLSNNDITGGNSGSPVLNGNGEMIGIAFDGNWEALSSDIIFNNHLQRCINVDIRYVLFIVDKFAGAGYLLDEMTIVE